MLPAYSTDSTSHFVSPRIATILKSFEILNMARITYNKLIRDFIPKKIEANSEAYEVRVITDDAEFEKELLKKVTEEASELSKTTSRDAFLAEYADLMVVLDALTAHFEFSSADIKDALSQNVEKKGLFKEKLFLSWSGNETPS